MIASAQSHLGKGEMREAIIQLKTAIQINPNSAQSRMLLGRALLESGEPGAAWLELSKAKELGPPAEALAPLQARVLVEQRDWPRLVEMFEALDLSDPQAQADLRVAVAVALASLGRADEAREHANRALSATPKHAAARMLLVRLAVAGGDSSTALTALEDVIRDEPRNHQAWQLKGDILLTSDLAASVQAYRQALELRADDIPSHVGLVIALVGQGDTDALAQEVQTLRQVQPRHPFSDYADAQLAYMKREDLRARELLQRVLRATGDTAEGLHLSGAVEYRLRSFVQAETFLTKSLALKPGSEPTRRALAATYLELGQPRRALEVLAPLGEQGQIDPDTLGVWGEAYLRAGDLRRAEATFRRAAALLPTDVRIGTSLARTLVRQGETQGGFALLDRLSAADAGTFPDMATLAERLRLRDFEGAMRALDAMEQKSEDKAAIAILRGQVLIQRGQPVEARAQFEQALSLNPKSFEATAGAAAVDMAEGQAARAKQRFEALLKLEPESYRVKLALADTAAKAGDPPATVLGLITEAVKLNPGGVAPQVSLISHHLRVRDVPAALSAAQAASAQFPNDPEIQNLLGRAQLAAGDAQQARTTFGRVVAMTPESPLGYVGQADAQVALKNIEAAVASLRRALAVSPGLVTAQIGITTLETAAGRYPQALAMAKEMQRQPQEAALGHLYEGDIEMLRKNPAAAASAYRAALQRADLTEAATKLHAALQAAGRAAEAESFAQTWITTRPKDAAFRFVLGDRAMTLKNHGEAERHFRAVVELKPEDAFALNNLAWLLLKRNDPSALAYAQRAAKLLPENAQALDTLATAQAQAGDLKAAVESQVKAVGLAPQDGDMRLALAKLHLQLGDRPAAEAELERLTRLGGRYPRQDEVQALLRGTR